MQSAEGLCDHPGWNNCAISAFNNFGNIKKPGLTAPGQGPIDYNHILRSAGCPMLRAARLLDLICAPGQQDPTGECGRAMVENGSWLKVAKSADVVAACPEIANAGPERLAYEEQKVEWLDVPQPRGAP